MNRRDTAALLLAFLAGCASLRPPSPQPLGDSAVAPSPPLAAPRSVRFLAFGDFGKGNEPQVWVAEAMAQVCAVRGCDFALMLGDNIYPTGVDGPDDPQFDEKFERPLRALDVPVYAVLGNHDNGGRGTGSQNARGDFEVAYTYRTDRASAKWHMPARYYRFHAPAGDGPPLAEFFALDSGPLAPTDADRDPKWDPATYGAVQQRWLQQVLRESTARWRIAFSHHPYRSNGYHGNAGDYENGASSNAPVARGVPWRDFVAGAVCGGDVDFLFSGHDHDLQWLEPDPACGKTRFIVSGAAASPYPHGRVINPSVWQKDQSLGFFWIELRDDDMTGAAYTLYEQRLGPEHVRSVLTLDASGRPLPAFERTLPRIAEGPVSVRRE